MMTAGDFQRFCANDGSRYAMSTPFVRRGFIYATDGRIIVRMTTDEGDTKQRPKSPQIPDVESLGWDEPTTTPQPWPEGGIVRGWASYETAADVRELGRRVGQHVIVPKYDELIRALPVPMYYAGYAANLGLPFVFEAGDVTQRKIGEGRVMGLHLSSYRFPPMQIAQ